MGMGFSAILHSVTKDVNAVEYFEILQEMSNAILKAESERMKAEAYEDDTLPIVAIVDTIKYSSIGVKTGVDEQVGEAIGDLFKGDKGNVLAGLQKGISIALNQFLGNAEMGRQEMTQSHVAFDNNALVRVDIYFYKYEFHSNAIMEHAKNMFCYVAQVGVLNCIKINPQVTLYELTKTIGKDNIREAQKQLEEETKFAKELYASIRRMTSAAANTGEASDKGKDMEAIKQADGQ